MTLLDYAVVCISALECMPMLRFIGRRESVNRSPSDCTTCIISAERRCIAPSVDGRVLRSDSSCQSSEAVQSSSLYLSVLLFVCLGIFPYACLSVRCGSACHLTRH